MSNTHKSVTDKDSRPSVSANKPSKLKRKEFEKQLEKLEVELVKLQEWVKHKGLKIVVIFE